MPLATIYLKPGKEQSVKRFHPWIFSGAIRNTSAELSEGDIVNVEDAYGNFLGIGYYQIGSIAVRLVTFKKEKIDEQFWLEKIKAAYELRKSIGIINNEETNGYRLVYGEGDNLPGLIIDIYNKTAVLQMHTIGMYNLRDVIVDSIKSIYGDEIEAIYDKSEDTLPYKANTNAVNGYVFGKSSSFIAKENGLQFNVDWEKGQKTGFFLDQRDNRALVEKYSKDRSVLNLFCYTGGFSLYAMRGGAKKVHSVDSSERAVLLAEENVELNFKGDERHKAFAKDAFKYLENTKHQYDLIILDPPAFAKHLKVVRNALQGYRRLNTKAIEVIKPGGFIFTYSCSQVISKDAFRTMIFSAAAKAGREVKVIDEMSQPSDHPISIYHPEGDYLKGLLLYVE